MDTYDLGHTTVVLRSPYTALPIGMGRKLNTAIAAAEAAQLIGAHVDHTLLPRIAPQFKQYLETSGRFHGAYGDRIGDQVQHAIRKLKNDTDTRQAVITLWNPALDNAAAHDIPCTVALNFAIVNDRLELRTQMRSNDVWLGFPYDIFQFTQLQITVARALGCVPGAYTHSTWSLHLYTKDLASVDALTGAIRTDLYQPKGFGTIGESWRTIKLGTRSVLRGYKPERPLTESEKWYLDQLRDYTTSRTPLD
jgi:thymidylate synthase